MEIASTAATRLCQACGMCCNGVLFHIVRLQPADDPQELVARGLRIRRKKQGRHFQQPCPAFRGSSCSIYPARPERCRLFRCQQLQRLEAGETSEAEALEKISDARQRVARITEMLEQAGHTDHKRPLSKRYEKIIAEPASDPDTIALHQNLTTEMNQLDAILDAEFRVA